MAKKSQYKLKYIIYGMQGVEISKIIENISVDGQRVLATNTFLQDSLITSGIKVITYQLRIANQHITISLHQISNAERFQYMLEIVSKGTHGAIVVYDSTREDTLANIEPTLHIIRDKSTKSKIALIDYTQTVTADTSEKEQMIKNMVEAYQITPYTMIRGEEGEISDIMEELIWQIFENAS